MTPCYQICKDRSCPHWDERMLECDRLPSTCDIAVEHLVSDERDLNQYLDGKEHGLWREWHENCQLRYEGNYVDGERHGKWFFWYGNGQLMCEENYKNGNLHGLSRVWYKNGQLNYEGNWVGGVIG